MSGSSKLRGAVLPWCTQVHAAQPEAAVQAAKALQVAWRIHMVRAQRRSTRRAELARRLQLVCAERCRGMRLRGGGNSGARVLRARAAVVYTGAEESSEALSVELGSDSDNDDGAPSSRGSAGGKGRRNGAALTKNIEIWRRVG